MVPSPTSPWQRAFSVAAFAWAAIGWVIVAWSLPNVNEDARLLVGAAGVLFPACAVLSGMAARRGRWRLAGLALVVSAATPTFFFWVPNAVALVVGIVLVVRPRSHSPSPRFAGLIDGRPLPVVSSAPQLMRRPWGKPVRFRR